MNRNFIKENFREFFPIYKRYKKNIQRVDAVRYFILKKYGGIYVDLDFQCFENIEPLLKGRSCIFGKEPKEHCSLHQKEMIISNAFMACEPSHPFMEKVTEEILIGRKRKHHVNDHILESTGPFMLTRVFQNQSSSDVTILDPELLYPLTKTEIETVLKGDDIPPEYHHKIDKAYAIHYYYGSWWKKKPDDLTRGLHFRNTKRTSTVSKTDRVEPGAP